MWFEALAVFARLCVPWWRVDAVGCGAARLTQQQIDQLEQRYRSLTCCR
ncbi:hypothetical protein I553_9105 [Mycobacterium xenopi 4042]|uniref:Uncharacterized protein n=1 Tax=Mycobacterium xenopi 4042 TaxID=1299334 RepID=X7YKU0_MYCXE|nr:hypothetical protein I553_9105 [Mycobacterium xenopi 4042]